MSAVAPLVSQPAQKQAAIPDDLIFRLSVEQYHQMIKAGILTTEDKLELLEGWLVAKMTKNPPHTVSTDLVQIELARSIPPGWYIRIQNPFTTQTSEPEPDVSVIRGEPRRYVDRHPNPAEVGLIVEVADSTLERDQKWKKRLYAAAGISVYWIVNLVQNRLEVYAEPVLTDKGAEYSSQQFLESEDQVPLILDGVEVALLRVADLLP